MEEELGDVLFTAVNLARHLKVDAESALRGSNAKFRRRFAAMELEVGGYEALGKLSAEELDRRWRGAKALEATDAGGRMLAGRMLARRMLARVVLARNDVSKATSDG